jgi:hypothetical protein
VTDDLAPQVPSQAATPGEMWGRIIPLRPGMPDPTTDAARRLSSARMAARGAELAATNAEGALTRAAIQEALAWHRAHPDGDHLDAAFAVAGHAAELGSSRWPEFVSAVREVTDAAVALDALREQEAER